MHRYLPDVPIRVVEGSERNLKVTHPLDVVVAEHLAGTAGAPDAGTTAGTTTGTTTGTTADTTAGATGTDLPETT